MTIDKIDERLKKLPSEKLVLFYDFVSYLIEQTGTQSEFGPASEAFQTMVASEAVLTRDWNRPEEDLAWADL